MKSDIRRHFFKIGIKSEDGDAFSFVWVMEAPTVSLCKDTIEEWRMTRVPIVSTSSSFVQTATIHYHLNAKEDKQNLREKLINILCG